MSTATIEVSRPKVGRLPKLPPAASARSPRSRWRNTATYFFLWVGLLGALFTASIMFKHSNTMTASILPAGEVPAVVVTPGNFDGGLPAAISDAQAAGLIEKSSATILLRDKESIIIGQMAKIPAENEHITEIKPASNIDNNAGRELLSIISKY